MNNSRLLRQCIIFFSFLVFPLLHASAGFTGVVYVDLNKNGEKEVNERGVKGVSVSDGLNVVITDGDGEYLLPGSLKSRFIFITVPSGFRTLRSFYIRTDGTASDYNFGLTSFQVAKSNRVKFIQLADTEASDDFGWVGPIRDYSANEGISFIVHTGDICYEKGLNFYGRNVTGETMGVPVYYCVGNHDLVKGNYGEELFEKNFGPVFYSFEAGNTHFIVTPMLTGDYQPSYTKEDVYLWMKNDLQAVAPGNSLVYTAPYSKPNATVESSPVLAGSMIIFGTSDRFLYAVDRDNGRIITKINLGAPVLGRACLEGNDLFVTDFSGNISCFSVMTY